MQTPATHELSPVMSRSAIELLGWIYCNRTATFSDTHWYTMDKVIPPDPRKPPKYAQFPDAPVRPRTYSQANS